MGCCESMSSRADDKQFQGLKAPLLGRSDHANMLELGPVDSQATKARHAKYARAAASDEDEDADDGDLGLNAVQIEARAEFQANKAKAAAVAEAAAAGITIHQGIICDGCSVSPIQGNRYQSTTADDFDLCALCEGSARFKETHGPFLKIPHHENPWEKMEREQALADAEQRKERMLAAGVLQDGRLLSEHDGVIFKYMGEHIPVFVVSHGAKYKVQVTNPFSERRASVTVHIDGNYAGGWILQPGECFDIERPSTIGKRFTFLQESYAVEAEKQATAFSPAGTGIVQGQAKNGLIKCCFTPEITAEERRKRALAIALADAALVAVTAAAVAAAAAEAAELAAGTEKADPCSIKAVLAELGLSQYLEAFTEGGYTTLHDIRLAELDDLITDLGLKKPHARLIIAEADKHRVDVSGRNDDRRRNRNKQRGGGGANFMDMLGESDEERRAQALAEQAFDLYAGATTLQGPSHQCFGCQVEDWVQIEEDKIEVIFKLMANNAASDSAKVSLVDTQSQSTPLKYASRFELSPSPEASIDHQLFAALNEHPAEKFRQCIQGLIKDPAFKSIGEAGLDYWVVKANQFHEAAQTSQIPIDTACFITSYTQEWYPYQFEGSHANAHSKGTCDFKGCPVLSQQPIGTASFAHCKGQPHGCSVCGIAHYCSAHCMETDWRSHKWPAVGIKSEDCNRSPYRVMNQRLLRKAMTSNDSLLGYTKMLMLSLGSMGSIAPCTVYRALSNLPRDLYDSFSEYEPGSEFVFNNVNSTSLDRAASESFLGEDTASNLRVFLTIQCIQGFAIEEFSDFPGEKEVIIAAGSVFRVTQKSCTGSRLNIFATQLPSQSAVSEALGITSASQQNFTSITASDVRSVPSGDVHYLFTRAGY
jgi:hypothetical protein